MPDAHVVGGWAGNVMSAVLSILEISGWHEYSDGYTFLGGMGVLDISDWRFGTDEERTSAYLVNGVFENRQGARERAMGESYAY